MKPSGERSRIFGPKYPPKATYSSGHSRWREDPRSSTSSTIRPRSTASDLHPRARCLRRRGRYRKLRPTRFGSSTHRNVQQLHDVSNTSRCVNTPNRQTVNTVIVGAGAAGLAVGACLKQKGVPFAILEAADAVGSSWRRHYDRLHLHTDKKHSELPHLPYPKDYPRYPSRDQLVRHLERYADHFELKPRFGIQVRSSVSQN
ncbi:MAG: NAD(P)-binding domain-containing protein, partial [Rhodothermia bacterium]|nr:NAD(P)-binding domain-containing protein [Rhodothermia bacterium]